MKTKIRLYFAVFACIFLTSSVLAQTDLSGSVDYHNDPDIPIEDVLVKLVDNSGTEIDSCLTDTNGDYIFYDVVDGTYQLICNTEIDPGGIDLADSFLIFLHLCNFYTLNPIEFLAADVNGSGTVTWSDYWTILIGWLVNGYPFPAGEWVFQEPTVVINSATKDSLVQGVGGSSTGDVDGSFMPGTKPEPLINIYQGSQQLVTTSEQVEIPVTIDWPHAVGGFALTLNYPGHLFELTGIKSDIKSFNYEIFDNYVKLSWMDTKFSNTTFDDKPLFFLVGRTTNHLVNGQKVTFTAGIQSHLMDGKGNILESVTMSMPSLEGEQVSTLFGQVYPNPVKSEFTVDYKLEKEGQVKVGLYNQNGQLVALLLDENKNAGVHNFKATIDSYDLNAGVYILVMEAPGNKIQKNIQQLIVSK
ncbi:MAG: T9SS type A sorting domain-containing protein [Bacteroidales bacterium]|nr:T9SS type A sorting domain-containing protein [Bacteroidales bacterium]MCF8344186.1 T9SS type A sorting domain-containing protein [Bacteroidales bacterium]MCF8350521.1 T9SS type A sorting domain-containing protein [Bacteroidales bacterium]MCF8375212.1 T9SS type A sorting domain-containing protein [Bacteroidales bacterium]MCF8400236.1 T9SS type A sorting domain-containing protein [Bacteroidales bacterium]